MPRSWWRWWKWPRRDAQPSPRTMGSIPFLMARPSVFFSDIVACLREFRSYEEKWKDQDDRELWWPYRDDNDGNGPAETLSRACAQWVQFLSNGQTVCFFLRHCGVFIYWRATLLAFKNYMVKWKDDRELSWWDRDDDDGNGPAETLSRARAQWVQFLFKLPHWVHVVLSGGCWHVRRLWCTR